MIELTVEKVIQLHKKMVSATGGEPNIRDIGLLESSVLSPYACFGEVEAYPTIKEKGARLGYSLTLNHAFFDGNKRIGVYAMMVFLIANGIKINPTNAQVEEIALSVASGGKGYDEILDWIDQVESK